MASLEREPIMKGQISSYIPAVLTAEVQAQEVKNLHDTPSMVKPQTERSIKASKTMIKAQDLWKEFPNGVQALQGVSFEVERGEFVALLGLSGAGKSTLLRCINGLIKPTKGEVWINDTPVGDAGADLRALRRQLSMIFQQFNLVKRLTVLENVLCGRLSYCNPLSSCCRFFSRADLHIAFEALERVHLTDKANVRADQLSGGQQQRVGIARALVQQPQAILADEPVSSLDPKTSRNIMEILQQINDTDHITVIASLHDVELALTYAHRVIGLQAGRVVLDSPVEGIRDEDLEYLYEQQRQEEALLEVI
jgi:phosphonate transport system ATP-binding protein